MTNKSVQYVDATYVCAKRERRDENFINKKCLVYKMAEFAFQAH